MSLSTTPPPTIALAIRAATTLLTDAGADTPRLDAEVLLRHLLGIDRTTLFLRLPQRLADETWRAYVALVERRVAGEPVAYLTGEREFMALPFVVGTGVLVPRPETEVLVEWAVDWLTPRPEATVVDVGTGSGAIALALAANQRERSDRIVACDLSRVALTYAATNRARLGLTDHVDLVRGDLLTWCRGPVDLILANLPYLRPDQRETNPDIHAEPVEALVSGADGLSAIRRLIADLPRVLAAGGAIALEIDPSQVRTVRAILGETLPRATIGVLHDLAGHGRIVLAELLTAT